MSKLEYAQCVAASLAYLTLQQQDSVGLVTFDQEIRALLRPSGNPSHLKQLLQLMEESRAERKTATGPIFHDLAERLKKRGIVVILSDLFDDVPAMLAGLKHFRHRRHEVVLFHVLDPAELDFPFRADHAVQRAGAIARRAERAARAAQGVPGGVRRLSVEQVQSGCREQTIDYVQLRTDQTLDVALASYLSLAIDQMPTGQPGFDGERRFD